MTKLVNFEFTFDDENLGYKDYIIECLNNMTDNLSGTSRITFISDDLTDVLIYRCKDDDNDVVCTALVEGGIIEGKWIGVVRNISLDKGNFIDFCLTESGILITEGKITDTETNEVNLYNRDSFIRLIEILNSTI